MRKVGSHVVALGIAAFAVASVSSAVGSLGLFDAGDQHESMGQSDTKPLMKAATYTAGSFGVAVKIRPPDGLWGGVQHESGSYRWIQLNHLHVPNTAPLTGVGYITLESATGATPTAATTLSNLRATPHVKFGAVTSVRVAGDAGKAFDAVITGVDVTKYCRANKSLCSAGISLAPFRTNQHCGFCVNTMHRETQDVKFAGVGQVFRIIVVNAHGKVVVIYIESNFADQKKFPPSKIFRTFLPYAKKMLAGISFG